MWTGFSHLLKKDFKLMLSSKFFLLALGSLILYSCYINFVYVNLDQDIFPVYLYDPLDRQAIHSEYIIRVNSHEALEAACADGYSVGFDFSTEQPGLLMISSGLSTLDNYRMSWGNAVLQGNMNGQAESIGTNNKNLKSRREISTEFLFFELSAVGFLGIASMLFKEKQMGVIRVHGILPVCRSMFILSKLLLILLADIVFASLLTLVNIGMPYAIEVLPAVLIQSGLLSLIMALIGFLCAIRLPDFKQFSLFYLVIAVFVTTPVFLAGQTGISWNWIIYHPMYHLFTAMKAAYFSKPAVGTSYYIVCLIVIALLFLLSYQTLSREMTKEG